MIMKTWNDYKEHVRTVDPEIGKDIDEVENISSIVSAMVEQRTSLGPVSYTHLDVYKRQGCGLLRIQYYRVPGIKFREGYL